MGGTAAGSLDAVVIQRKRWINIGYFFSTGLALSGVAAGTTVMVARGNSSLIHIMLTMYLGTVLCLLCGRAALSNELYGLHGLNLEAMYLYIYVPFTIYMLYFFGAPLHSHACYFLLCTGHIAVCILLQPCIVLPGGTHVVPPHQSLVLFTLIPAYVYYDYLREVQIEHTLQPLEYCPRGLCFFLASAGFCILLTAALTIDVDTNSGAAATAARRNSLRASSVGLFSAQCAPRPPHRAAWGAGELPTRLLHALDWWLERIPQLPVLSRVHALWDWAILQLSSRADHSLVLLCTLGPYLLYAFTVGHYNMVAYGDFDAAGKVSPTFHLTTMLASIACARVDISAVLRKVRRTTQLLHDLVPPHIAEAMMTADADEPHQQQPPQQQQLRGGADGMALRRAGRSQGDAFERPSLPERERCAPRARGPPPRTPSTQWRAHLQPLQRLLEDDGSPPQTQRPHAHAHAVPPLPQQLRPQLQQLQQLQPAAAAWPADTPQPTPSHSESSRRRGADDDVGAGAAGAVAVAGAGAGAGAAPTLFRVSSMTASQAAQASSMLHFAEWHESCTVLFVDIVGFTELAHQVGPEEVMIMLNDLYTRFDNLAVQMPIYKVETIGDCYMAASGLVHDDPDHAGTMVSFALAMLQEAAQVRSPADGGTVHIRIGIHSGRVMSGVVGRIRRRYCLFGDTVNTASRMESTGIPDTIHVSADTHALLLQRHGGLRWHCRGSINVKGKGQLTTYVLQL